jgi:phage FluMu protein Com
MTAETRHVTGESHVTGYACPRCKTVMNDIEIRSDMSGIVGWAFRVPLRATKHIRCASCGADVPRENWTITDPQ